MGFSTIHHLSHHTLLVYSNLSYVKCSKKCSLIFFSYLISLMGQQVKQDCQGGTSKIVWRCRIYISSRNIHHVSFSLILKQLLVLKLQKHVWIHIIISWFLLVSSFKGSSVFTRNRKDWKAENQIQTQPSSESTVRTDTHILTWKQM